MEKKYYILIGEEEIPVTKEVYYEYKRPVWREKKRAAVRAEKEISYDAMVKNGVELKDPEALEALVADQILLEALCNALNDLTEGEKSLINGLFFHGKSERQVSKETGVPRKTISYRRKIVLNKLKKILEKS